MKRLEAERKRIGLGQSKLAQAAGLNPSYVSWAENGRFILYEAQLRKLADSLGLEPDEWSTLLEDGYELLVTRNGEPICQSK